VILVPKTGLLPFFHRFPYYTTRNASWYDKLEDAVASFRQTFVPYLDEVKRRTFFIQKEDGEKVANFTAWWG
jgi:hypothetical protein